MSDWVERDEPAGRALLLDEDQARAAASWLGDLAAGYPACVADGPVTPPVDREWIRRLLREPIPAAGRPIEALLEEFGEQVVGNACHIAHPRYLAYVLASPHGLSPFAEAAAAILNNSNSIAALSPGGTAMELRVLDWLRGLFGFPPGGAGLLTSGGSLANFNALAAARDRALGADARSLGLQGGSPPLVAYTSDQVHASVEEAVSLLGLGTDQLRRVESDALGRIRLDRLERAIEQDRRDGLAPFCVVGAAGTITVGAIDPLADLAGLCRREDLWLHVDGAYGALFVLTERHADALRDAGLADSLTLDPHKLLFSSLEAGCALFRREEDARRSFDFHAPYIDRRADDDLVDFADLGPELSRGNRALKVWWGLRGFGTDAYRETLERLLALAQQMGRRIEAEPELELLAPVTLTAVCFRHRALDSRGNQALLEAVVRSGLAHLGPAHVGDRTGIRACFTNLHTRPSDVDAVLDGLLELATRVSTGRA
jgi:glutamate/tyrosine decarboxylase-like PLP-dependent enzyme